MSHWKVVVMLAMLAVVAPPVAAQPPPSQHGYVVGFGGVTSTEVTSPFFGGTGGFNVTPDLLITGEMSRSQEVLPGFTREDLGLLDSGLQTELGASSVSTVKVPTNFYSAGIRYQLPMNDRVRPYVSAGTGVAHMSPKPSFVIDGLDLTSLLLQEDLLKTTFREETRPLVAVGGGVNVTAGRHATFDFGYRYAGIFIKTDYLQDYEVSPHSHDRIDTHKVYAGAGFTF